MKRIISYFFPSETKQSVLEAFVAEMVKINNKHPNINYGGCGVFAVLLYDKLKALGFRPKIAVMAYSKKNFLDSQDMYFDCGLDYYYRNRTEGFCHVIVKAGGYYIDSTGAYKDYKDMKHYRRSFDFIEKVNVDFLRACSNEKRFWNDTFNRRQIPTITKKIEKIYEKISKKSLVVSE